MIDFANFSGLQTAVAVAASWVTWYTWKFFLSPLVYRDEPKELPYALPCKATVAANFCVRYSKTEIVVGHTLSMITGAHRMFLNGRYAFHVRRSSLDSLTSSCRERFGNEPWAVTIMGQSLYVIPSADGVQAVYRAPKTLDFDPFIKEMLSKYGITADTATKMFDTLPGHNKNWMETSIDNFKLQMHPGDKLEYVQRRLLGFIDKSLVWERLRGRMVHKDGDAERIVSLYTWSEMVIVDAQTRAFFDEVLFEKCPELLAQFQIYEDESWKLPMDLPSFATKHLRSSKSAIEKGLRQYLRIPKEQRPNDSWIIKTLCEDMVNLGLDETQKVHILFSFYRV